MKKYFRFAGKLGFVLWFLSFVVLIIFYILSSTPEEVKIGYGETMTVGGLEWWGHLYYIGTIILSLILGPAVCLLLIHVGKEGETPKSENKKRVTKKSKEVVKKEKSTKKEAEKAVFKSVDEISELCNLKYYNMTHEIYVYGDEFHKFFEVGKIADLQISELKVTFVYAHKKYVFNFESINDIKTLERLFKK